MENENLRNIENLLAAKASTQPLYEFPVDQRQSNNSDANILEFHINDLLSLLVNV